MCILGNYSALRFYIAVQFQLTCSRIWRARGSRHSSSRSYITLSKRFLKLLWTLPFCLGVSHCTQKQNQIVSLFLCVWEELETVRNPYVPSTSYVVVNMGHYGCLLVFLCTTISGIFSSLAEGDSPLRTWLMLTGILLFGGCFQLCFLAPSPLDTRRSGENFNAMV